MCNYARELNFAFSKESFRLVKVQYVLQSHGLRWSREGGCPYGYKLVSRCHVLCSDDCLEVAFQQAVG